jgi:hypothetical protein
MRARPALGAVLATLAGVPLASPALAAPTLVIRHAAVRIVILPENRSDIAIDVYQPNSRLPLEVRREGDRAIIDGHLVDWLTSCHGSGDDLHALVLFNGDFPVAQMPQVQVRVPVDAVVESGGVVHGAVTRSRNLTLDHSGCGDWTVANVAGELRTSVSGVGDVRTGSAHAADVSLSGAAHLALGPVDTLLTARLSGAGSVSVRSAGAADVAMSGAGGVSTGPIAGALTSHLSGAGNLSVESVGGPVSVEVSGVGGVKIAGGHASSVDAQVSGAGHIDFDGVADSLTANVSGVGDINVARVTGPVDRHVSGVGNVRVGGR